MFFAYRKKSSNEDRNIQLPLAPMADVFIVILLFILKALSNDGSGYSPSVDIALPHASGRDIIAQTLRVDVSKSDVMVDGQLVLTLTDYRFLDKDLDENGIPKPLESSLTKTLSGTPLSIYADQAAPYATIRTILNVAAAAGYRDLQIAVTGER